MPRRQGQNEPDFPKLLRPCIENDGNEFMHSRHNVEIEQRPKLANLRRINAWLLQVQMDRLSPTMPSKIIPAMMLDQEVKQERKNFEPVSGPQNQGRTVGKMIWNDPPGVHSKSSQKGRQFLLFHNRDDPDDPCRPEIPLPWTDWSPDEIKSITRFLSRVLNRVPITTSTKEYASLFKTAARQWFERYYQYSRFEPQHISCHFGVSTTSNRPRRDAGIRVDHIVPGGDAMTTSLNLDPHKVNEDVRTPEIPDWVRYQPVQIPSTVQYPERWEAAIKHLKYFKWVSDGAMCSKFDLTSSFDAYLEQIYRVIKDDRRTTKSKSVGPFLGKPAWVIRTANPGKGKQLGARIRPSEFAIVKISTSKASDDMGLAEIRVNSLDQSRINKVLETWMQFWMIHQDYLRGYYEAAYMADLVNIAISEARPTPSSCTCGEAERSSRFHLCDRCNRISNCKSMSIDEDSQQRLCRDCINYAPADHSLAPVAHFKAMISKCCTYDHRHGGPNCFDELVEHFQLDSATDRDRYEDAYVPSQTRSFADNATRDAKGLWRSPFRPSLDAVLPFFRRKHGCTARHCPENVVVTAQYLNYATNVFPKGTLTVLSRYAAKSDQEQKDPEFRKQFETQIKAIETVVRQTPFVLTKRMSRDLSEDEFERFQLSWRTLSPQHQIPAVKNEYFFSSWSADPDWRPNRFPKLLELVQQIEDFWKARRPELQIERKGEECPYPFGDVCRPPVWSWWQAWCTFGRMLYM